MPPEPLLSICIPTYNRSRFLRETLESVLTSLGRVTAPCELLVCDNASPDDTQAVLHEFRARWPSLKVFRNPENIEEMNFYTTLHHATGKYVWLLGDDDLVDPDFLPTVMERLAENPDLVVCNHSIHSIDFSKRYREVFHSRSIPESLETRDDVLASFGVGLGFISAAVIRRAQIVTVPREMFVRFSAYGLSFFTALCSALEPRSQTAFVREPLLRYRGGNSATFDWEKFFVDGVAASLQHFAEIGYSPAAILRAKNHTVRNYLIPRIAQLKKDGRSTNLLLSRAAPVFSEAPAFRLLAVPLAAFPETFYSALRWLRRRS